MEDINDFATDKKEVGSESLSPSPSRKLILFWDKYWWVIMSIFFLSVLLILFLYTPQSIENSSKDITDCKLRYWEYCGLEVKNDTSQMCYQSENNTDKIWDDCPVASDESIDCWLDGLSKCYEVYNVSI